MKIPLHELLLDLRRDLVEEGVAPCHRAALRSGCGRGRGRRPGGYRQSTRAGAPRAAAGRARRAGPDVGARPGPAAVRPPLPGPPTVRDDAEYTGALVDEFVASAEAVGFHVHRREAPTLEGAGISTAIYGLADTGSVVLAAVAGRAPRAVAPAGRPRHAAARGPDPARSGRAVRRARRRSPERARDRHRPEPERRHRAEARRRRPRAGRGARRPAVRGPGSIGSARCFRSTVPGRSSASG